MLIKPVFIINVLLIWFLSGNLLAEIFKGGTEPLADKVGTKNGQFKKIIKIAGSDALILQIRGQLHTQETLRIYDIWTHKTGKLRKSFTGTTFNNTQTFIIKGDDLLITLNSTAPDANRPGVYINVQAYNQVPARQVDGLKTEFEGGTYELVLRRVDYLNIPNSEYLKVDIAGDLDAKETLRIYEMQGKKTGRQLFEHTGTLEKIAPLIAMGDTVKITLNSDNKTSIRPGVVVTISSYSANQRLNRLRAQLKNQLEQFARFKTAGVLEQLDLEIKALDELNTALSQVNGLQKEVSLRQKISNQFHQLSVGYSDIAKRLQQVVLNGDNTMQVLQYSQQKLTTYIKTATSQQIPLKKYLQQLKNARQRSNTDSENKRLQADFKAKNSRYKRLKVQKQIWQDAGNIYQQLAQQTQSYLYLLQDFHFMLAQQSEIYQNHAKILLRDINLVDTNISHLAQLSKQLDLLQQAWKAIIASQEALDAISL